MTMSKFFEKAGSLSGHKIEYLGDSPRRTVIVVFTYSNGIAKFDGAHWVFKLNKE